MAIYEELRGRTSTIRSLTNSSLDGSVYRHDYRLCPATVLLVYDLMFLLAIAEQQKVCVLLPGHLFSPSRK
jgi:hypothetical protein